MLGGLSVGGMVWQSLVCWWYGLAEAKLCHCRYPVIWEPKETRHKHLMLMLKVFCDCYFVWHLFCVGRQRIARYFGVKLKHYTGSGLQNIVQDEGK